MEPYAWDFEHFSGLSKTTSEEEIYELKQTIDQCNFRIYQVEKETGIELISYEVSENEVWATEWARIPEKIEGAKIKRFSYEKALDRDFKHRMIEAANKLTDACYARKHFLAEAKKLRKRAKLPELDFRVRLGVYNMQVIFSDEVMAKYDIMIESPDFFNVYQQARKATGRGTETWLKFRWDDQGILSFDNTLEYLRWKVEKYQKIKPLKDRLFKLYLDFENFNDWEKQAFATRKAPSN